MSRRQFVIDTSLLGVCTPSFAKPLSRQQSPWKLARGRYVVFRVIRVSNYYSCNAIVKCTWYIWSKDRRWVGASVIPVLRVWLDLEMRSLPSALNGWTYYTTTILLVLVCSVECNACAATGVWRHYAPQARYMFVQSGANAKDARATVSILIAPTQFLRLQASFVGSSLLIDALCQKNDFCEFWTSQGINIVSCPKK